MFHELCVSLVDSKDCFLHLNESTFKRITKNHITPNSAVLIKFGENFSNEAFSSLGSCIGGLKDNVVGISAAYAHCLELHDEDEVILWNCSAKSLQRVDFRLNDESQYELMREHLKDLEENLLNQINVVFECQTVPYTIHGNVIIYLRIEKLHPGLSYGKLKQFTELAFINSFEKCDDAVIGTDCDSAKFLSSNIFNKVKFWFGRFFPINGKYRNEFVNNFNSMLQQTTKLPDNSWFSYVGGGKHTYKVKPSLCIENEIPKRYADSYLFIRSFPISDSSNFDLCLPKILCRIAVCSDKRTNEIPNITCNYILAYVASFGNGTTCIDNEIYCPLSIMKALQLRVGSIVCIERAEIDQSMDLKHSFCNEITSSEIETKEHFFTEEALKIYQDVILTVMDNIKVNQRLNSLILGGMGVGKTFLLNSLQEFFERHRLHVAKIDCKTLIKMKSTNLSKLITEKLSECCKFQPSVLTIDDLDVLTVDDEAENQYQSIYSEHIGNLMVSLLSECQKLNDVSIVATASSLTKLKRMSTDRGPMIFESIHTISELAANDRESILRRLILERKADPSLLSSDVINKTSGYHIQDLIDVLEMARLISLLRSNDSFESIVKLNKSDLTEALLEKKPLALSGVNLDKINHTKWNDVGGMNAAKKILSETFAWPFRYRDIFQSCPLRQQCGVLLYGAPGTGKTLIAGAVANEFGMNFISIKGPEVFSKYVGASEEGVRNLFARARKARPCILFFDEFDSLATKRGSDTGDVNDRVVNQILTELDGVEELTGVFLLAATSRPDLLDPALLRPGRIDRVVHCPLPDQAERLAILEALSKNLEFASDVNLKEIAEKTEGYTGADLQAVLYSAQTAFIKQIAKNGRDELALRFQQCHLMTGISETKPSISESDRLRYDYIYESFFASRKDATRDIPQNKQQRVMFA